MDGSPRVGDFSAETATGVSEACNVGDRTGRGNERHARSPFPHTILPNACERRLLDILRERATRVVAEAMRGLRRMAALVGFAGTLRSKASRSAAVTVSLGRPSGCRQTRSSSARVAQVGQAAGVLASTGMGASSSRSTVRVAARFLIGLGAPRRMPAKVSATWASSVGEGQPAARCRKRMAARRRSRVLAARPRRAPGPGRPPIRAARPAAGQGGCCRPWCGSDRRARTPSQMPGCRRRR